MLDPKELLNLENAKYFPQIGPLLDSQRFNNMDFVLSHVKSPLPQNALILEFGVFQGASLKYLAEHFKPLTVYGFDSFKGIPEDWASLPRGSFAIEDHLIPTGIPNTELVKGYFEDTCIEFEKQHRDQELVFVHIDCDCYSSTKYVLNTFKEQIFRDKPIILFDDLINYEGWQVGGEYRGFSEFVEETGLKYEILSWTNYMEVGIKIL